MQKMPQLRCRPAGRPVRLRHGSHHTYAPNRAHPSGENARQPIMNLKQKRKAAVDSAQAIITKAPAAAWDLTADERRQLEAKAAQFEALSKTIDEADRDGDLISKMNALGGDLPRGRPGHRSSLLQGRGGQGPPDLGGQRSQREGPDRRRLPDHRDRGPAADRAVGTPRRQPARSPPARVVAENFSYLRQTVRTNNAAPVATGALKPTSISTLARVESRLRVIAHLSDRSRSTGSRTLCPSASLWSPRRSAVFVTR